MILAARAQLLLDLQVPWELGLVSLEIIKWREEGLKKDIWLLCILKKHFCFSKAQYISTNTHQKPNRICKLFLCLKAVSRASALKAGLTLLPGWVSKHPIAFHREKCIKMPLQDSPVVRIYLVRVCWSFSPSDMRFLTMFLTSFILPCCSRL